MWRNIWNKMRVIKQHHKETSNVVNKNILRRGGPLGSGGPANVQNILICLGFFRLDSFLLAEISVIGPLIHLGITLLISTESSIYPVAPASNHLPTSLDIDYNFSWIFASIMRLWFEFLFDIHVPLVFSTPNSFCPICILDASVSQDSYDAKKLSEIFVEPNNTPNRRAGSKLAVFQGILSNSETYLLRSYISAHFTMYSKHK